MLGYVLGAAAWGYLKAQGAGAKRSHNALAGLPVPELLEELQYRGAIERGALKRVVSPGAARAITAGLFALVHPGNELDAALGSLVYSKAYDAGSERWGGHIGGLGFATLVHAVHNAAVWLGANP
jgi:membrane protease YdiL (CAAX protease family)